MQVLAAKDSLHNHNVAFFLTYMYIKLGVKRSLERKQEEIIITRMAEKKTE